MSTVTFKRTPVQEKLDALILARVKAGIALLEEKHGPDWVDLIDLPTLDLGSANRCVLGQAYGDYEYGLARLGLDQTDHDESDEAIAHGFETDCCGYEELQKAWEKVLTPMVRS